MLFPQKIKITIFQDVVGPSKQQPKSSLLFRSFANKI